MAVLAEPDTSSPAVLEAQKLLNKATRQSRVAENGAFDKNTVAVLKQFQKESGLRETGVLDDKVMAVLRKAADEERPKWQVTVNGKTYLLTDADYAALITRLKKEFARPMGQLRGAVEEARLLWNDMHKLNKEQYIVSWVIEAYNSKSLPPESVVKVAEKALEEADKALNSGNMRAFAVIFPKAQRLANSARADMKDYVSGMIEGGGSIVTGLEFVSTTSFVIVGVLAAPVAASYGMGAVAAGVVAGAGTSAVETLANEVGKGFAGQSKGVGDAALNVLRDAAIGAGIGALVKGKGAEKILEKLAPLVAKQMAGAFFKKASEKAVVRFLIAYFKKNGADILEGVMTDVLKEYKSKADGLTVDKFLGIVAKQVVTAGIFSKFAKLGDVTGKAILSNLSGKVKQDLIKSLGAKAKEADLEPIFAKAFEEFYKEGGGKVYDKVLDAATGSETPEQLDKKIMDELATSKKLIDLVKDECEKQAKKKK